MPATPDDKGDPLAVAMDAKKSSKLGLVSGVYIPVCLNIMSILMFLRFGLILGQVGFMGILGMSQSLIHRFNLLAALLTHTRTLGYCLCCRSFDNLVPFCHCLQW